MIRADTFYTEAELNKEGVSQGEFLQLRMAGLRGMRRGGGTTAWYDGAEVQRFQRQVNTVLTKAPRVKPRARRFENGKALSRPA